MTYQELSRRARVTRQTLYRHWPTRESLFVDLALERADEGLPDVATTPAAVLRGFLEGLIAGLDDMANTAPLTALIGAATHDPTSADALRTIVSDRQTALNALLQPMGVVVGEEAYAVLCGPVIFQRFLAQRPAGGLPLDEIAAATLALASPAEVEVDRVAVVESATAQTRWQK